MTGTKEHSRHMFAAGFQERHDLEQYFWTTQTVFRLLDAIRSICPGNFGEYIPNQNVDGSCNECCCLTAPSLAQAFFEHERPQVLLDNDTRFLYLPRFHVFDLRQPSSTVVDACPAFRVIAFDPPFFSVPITEMYRAVCMLARENRATALLISFLRREEQTLLSTFASFRLQRTTFEVEYATVKPNKWRNYALYSNADLPGIRRIRNVKT